MIIDLTLFVNVYFRVLFEQKSALYIRLFLYTILLAHSSIIVYYNNKENDRKCHCD